jgi:hypothetical protein
LLLVTVDIMAVAWQWLMMRQSMTNAWICTAWNTSTGGKSFCWYQQCGEEQHANWSGVRTLQGKEFDIYTRKPHPINADGEIVTYTPAKFRLIPKAVAVFVPNSSTNAGQLTGGKQQITDQG